jgi:hypothetical protein
MSGYQSTFAESCRRIADLIGEAQLRSNPIDQSPSPPSISYPPTGLSCNRACRRHSAARRLVGNVRYWHKADMLNALMNVRFEGKNGHDAGVTPFPLMTHSRHAASTGQA